MEYTADNIETKITLLPSLLKIFSMIQISFCYEKENVEENVMENIAIRCSNCGKTTGLYIYHDHQYQDFASIIESIQYDQNI